MTQISADLVRQLREMTGAPMMDAKRALVDAEGDLEAAKQLLRERGMASAGKRAGNQTPEGVVLTRLDEAKGTIVAIGSETEPVSKNDEFRAFAEKVLDIVEENGPDAVESLEDERKELVGKIGENIIVGGAQARDAHRVRRAAVRDARRGARGRGRPRARDLHEAARRRVEARTGPREDRRGHAGQAVLRRERARRAGVDPRAQEDGRAGA